MDFNSYTFQIKDLPMIISVSLICIYVFTLFITLIVSIGRNRQQIERTNTTRKLNPKLGFLGLLGFWGFAGFWTYSIDGSVFPFAFSYSLASSDFTMKEKCREHLWMNASVKTQSLPNWKHLKLLFNHSDCIDSSMSRKAFGKFWIYLDSYNYCFVPCTGFGNFSFRIFTLPLWSRWPRRWKRGIRDGRVWV